MKELEPVLDAQVIVLVFVRVVRAEMGGGGGGHKTLIWVGKHGAGLAAAQLFCNEVGQCVWGCVGPYQSVLLGRVNHLVGIEPGNEGLVPDLEKRVADAAKESKQDSKGEKMSARVLGGLQVRSRLLAVGDHKHAEDGKGLAGLKALSADEQDRKQIGEAAICVEDGGDGGHVCKRHRAVPAHEGQRKEQGELDKLPEQPGQMTADHYRIQRIIEELAA